MLHDTNKAEIIKCIQQLVPPGSPEPQDSKVIASLQSLTAALIQAYMEEGQLQADPFADARKRMVHLYEAEVRSKLQAKVVLVRGMRR